MVVIIKNARQYFVCKSRIPQRLQRFKQSGIEQNGWNYQGRRSTIFRLSVKNSTASLISTKANKTKRLKLSRSQRSTIYRL